jgi:hypothetical protein
MRFEFRREDSLLRLARCARLCEGDDRAALLHGPWVEARGDWFVEGAWNGPFSEGRFDRAHTLVGTGGRLAWKTVFSPALHGRYSSAVHPFRFTFHWGIERMKSR